MPPAPIVVGGSPGRCCMGKDDGLIGPSCYCTGAECRTDEVEVAECAPRVVAYQCGGPDSPVDTCTK